MQQEQLTQQISLYHTFFLICLILFILFLLVDIFLFIKLEILKVIGYLTGKTERKTVEKMISGEVSLKKGSSKKGEKIKNSIREEKKKKTIMTPSGQLKTPDGTGVMMPTGGDITDVLGSKMTTDDVASTASPGVEMESKNRKKYTTNRFIIEKEILFLHTDERI